MKAQAIIADALAEAEVEITDAALPGELDSGGWLSCNSYQGRHVRLLSNHVCQRIRSARQCSVLSFQGSMLRCSFIYDSARSMRDVADMVDMSYLPACLGRAKLFFCGSGRAQEAKSQESHGGRESGAHQGSRSIGYFLSVQSAQGAN